MTAQPLPPAVPGRLLSPLLVGRDRCQQPLPGSLLVGHTEGVHAAPHGCWERLPGRCVLVCKVLVRKIFPSASQALKRAACSCWEGRGSSKDQLLPSTHRGGRELWCWPLCPFCCPRGLLPAGLNSEEGLTYLTIMGYKNVSGEKMLSLQ